MTDHQEKEIRNRLAKLYAAAAVGVRHEEIKGLESQLRGLQRPRAEAPTLVQEALAILKWLREPDYEEEFSLQDTVTWLNRRPVAEMCRVVDGCVGVAQEAQQPRWRHKKRGSIVTEIARGFAQVAHHPIEEMTCVVIYRHDDDGRYWVRNAVEFDDGRFEALRETTNGN